MVLITFDSCGGSDFLSFISIFNKNSWCGTYISELHILLTSMLLYGYFNFLSKNVPVDYYFCTYQYNMVPVPVPYLYNIPVWKYFQKIDDCKLLLWSHLYTKVRTWACPYVSKSIATVSIKNMNKDIPYLRKISPIKNQYYYIK